MTACNLTINRSDVDIIIIEFIYMLLSRGMIYDIHSLAYHIFIRYFIYE